VDVDVALVPSQARRWRRTVCVVIDELRASSTITTLLDLGCTDLVLTASLAEARRLGRERGSFLAGERHGVTPRGFDANNSPAELRRADLRGRGVVLCTSNGTVVLDRLRQMPATLVGCLLNATACAEAAVGLAESLGADIGLVCAGMLGRFALDDAYAAGAIVERIVQIAAKRGTAVRLRDPARAVVHVRSSYPDAMAAFSVAETGHLVLEIGAEADLELCARVDSSRAVPILRAGHPLRIDRYAGA
jgi:2-phosphosulfolactate phosphatase